MRLLAQLLFSLYGALLPGKLWAPAHVTERPTIAWLIAYSASSRGVPFDPVLRRGWAESGWKNAVLGNREGCQDVGPMQVNSCYWPKALAMNVSDRVDLGVAIYASWWKACGGDERCASRAYVRGHR